MTRGKMRVLIAAATFGESDHEAEIINRMLTLEDFSALLFHQHRRVMRMISALFRLALQDGRGRSTTLSSKAA